MKTTASILAIFLLHFAGCSPSGSAIKEEDKAKTLSVQKLRSFLGPAIALGVERGGLLPSRLIGEGFLTPQLAQEIGQGELQGLCADVYRLRPALLRDSMAYSNIRLFPRPVPNGQQIPDVGFWVFVQLGEKVYAYDDGGTTYDLEQLQHLIEQRIAASDDSQAVWEQHSKYLSQLRPR